MNTVAYFEIQVEDVTRAATFYGDLFGWKFRKDETIAVEYWRIEGAGPFGGLLQRPAKTPRGEDGTNAFVCSIQVEHFDEMSEKILRHGGVVALAKFAVVGKCWQGYFLDTEGNTFGIFQVDSKAV